MTTVHALVRAGAQALGRESTPFGTGRWVVSFSVDSVDVDVSVLEADAFAGTARLRARVLAGVSDDERIVCIRVKHLLRSYGDRARGAAWKLVPDRRFCPELLPPATTWCPVHVPQGSAALITIMSLIERGLNRQARAMIDTSVPTEPWENTVAALLRAHCRPPRPHPTSPYARYSR